MLYRGKNKVKVYKGGYGAPTNNSLAGWTPEIQTGKNLSFENTYKDVVSPLIINGESNQTKTTQNKNLFDLSLANGTYTNATCTVVISSGTITITPMVGSTASTIYCDVPFNQHFPAGTYYWKYTTTRKDTESNYDNIGYLRVLDGEIAYAEIGQYAATTTVGFTITYIRVYFRITVTTAITSGQYNTYNNFQFELGSTATSYVPFIPNSPSPKYHSDIVSTGDTEDITITAQSENLTNIANQTVTISNTYYVDYFPQNPKVLLQPSTAYTIAFDYVINSATDVVSCGIGYGILSYTKDICRVDYPTQTTGRYIRTFYAPSSFTVGTPYLQLRLARMNSVGSLNVSISNAVVAKGSYATLPYIPYYTFSTVTYDKVLRGIPATYNTDGSVATWAYRDWIDNDTGLIHRQTYNPIILTGTEAISKNGTVTTEYLYYILAANIGVTITSSTKCLVSHLQYNPNCTSTGTVNVGYKTGVSPQVLYINLGYALTTNTVAGIKAWFAAEYAKGTPFTVLISRETEITEPITAQPLATTPKYCNISANAEITATVKIMNT